MNCKKCLVTFFFTGILIGPGTSTHAQYPQFNVKAGTDRVHFAEARYSVTSSLKNRVFYDFMSSVETESSFADHSQIGFVFHQQNLFKRSIHLYEHFFVLSQIGMGAELGVSFPLHTNRVFRVQPASKALISSISNGLRDYTMLHYYLGVGLNIAFMPAESFIISGIYYPRYDVRYGSHEKELLTFKGSGWEYGFTLLLSNRMIHPFSFLIFDVDLSRIPISFTVTTIRDSFSDKQILLKKLTIGILLN